MGRFIDLTGQRFGHLVVERKATPTKDGAVQWLCTCDCGTRKEIRGKHLRDGRSKSCGCYRVKNTAKMFTKHGMSESRIYTIWVGMKDRCTNVHNVEYEQYGGRGILVCEEWQTFEPFYEWAFANGYREELTIDRVDNNGNYEPSNCRWSTYSEQANNTSRNHVLRFNDEEHTIREWEDILGVRPNTIRGRIWKGWTVEQALTTPVGRRRSK